MRRDGERVLACALVVVTTAGVAACKEQPSPAAHPLEIPSATATATATAIASATTTADPTVADAIPCLGASWTTLAATAADGWSPDRACNGASVTYRRAQGKLEMTIAFPFGGGKSAATMRTALLTVFPNLPPPLRSVGSCPPAFADQGGYRQAVFRFGAQTVVAESAPGDSRGAIFELRTSPPATEDADASAFPWDGGAPCDQKTTPPSRAGAGAARGGGAPAGDVVTTPSSVQPGTKPPHPGSRPGE